MYNKTISTILFFLLCIYSLCAQENPVVGFSIGKHMGPVISKDISKRGHIVASVAKDHTLMIWDYPSFEFRKAINLPGDIISPVCYGVCAIIPSNPNIILVADNTGEIYENNLYRSQLKHRLKRKNKENLLEFYPFEDDREGILYDNTKESITTQYSFIAVDVEQNKVIDRVGALSAVVADFVFSPDESYLLAVTKGEEAVLYSTWGLRQVSQFLFEDERILGACFLNKEELVFLTDINYYKFRISNNGVNTAIEKERLIKRSIRSRYETNSVKIVQKDGLAYLIDKSWGNRNNIFGSLRVSAIQLNDGKKIQTTINDMFAPTAEDLKRKEGVKIEVRHGISSGGVLTTHEEVIELSELQRNNIIHEMIRKDKIESFLKNERDTINSHLFEYRKQNYAAIEITPDGIKFEYPDCSGQFNKSGISITKGVFANCVKNKWISAEDDNTIFIYPYSVTPQIWKTGDNGFKSLLPIEADAIYPWINSHHYIVTLTDGSIRWYNKHTGKEELSLFVSKEGNYVIWAPNGTYMSDSDFLADQIEWRYRRFSNVVTTRPVNERLRYYWPSEIKRLIEQLFDPDVEELGSRYSGTNESILSINVEADSSLCFVNYSLNDYNPVKYGPYELSLIVEDDKDAYSQIDEYSHQARTKGGALEFSIPAGSKNVILELIIESNNQSTVLAYDRKPIGGEMIPRDIILTCIGINDYSEFGNYSNLRAPIHDANAVKSVLENLNSRSIKQKNSALLYKEVTIETILKRIDDIRKMSGPETLSVFYFSGHGDKKNGQYVFISDKEMIDISSILTSAELIPGNKVFIFDSCYSGSSFNAEYANTAIIASSDAFTQSVDGSELRESPFTRKLVDCIQKKSREGNSLSLDELFGSLLEGWDGEQKPQIYNNIGKIIIFKP